MLEDSTSELDSQKNEIKSTILNKVELLYDLQCEQKELQKKMSGSIVLSEIETYKSKHNRIIDLIKAEKILLDCAIKQLKEFKTLND